jgi:hypothetical protein
VIAVQNYYFPNILNTANFCIVARLRRKGYFDNLHFRQKHVSCNLLQQFFRGIIPALLPLYLVGCQCRQ